MSRFVSNTSNLRAHLRALAGAALCALSGNAALAQGTLPPPPAARPPQHGQPVPRTQDWQEWQDTQQTPDGTITTREKRLLKPNEWTVFKETLTVNDTGRSTGFALFLGVNGGYITAMPATEDVEGSKTGYQLGGKFLGSIYPENWVFDFGVGWFYSKLSGEDYLVDEETGRYRKDPQNVTILTQAAFGEIAPRYRLSHNWQLGVVADFMFGTDLAFSTIDSDQTFTIMGGAQLMYGVPEKFADMRWGLEFLTDLNVADRQTYAVLLSAQWGLPILKPDRIVRDRELQSIRVKQERQEVPRYVNKVVVKEVVKFVFDADEIKFEARRPVLAPQSQSYLLELAQVLLSAKDTWKELSVEGHVNFMGDERENVRLSQGRAAAVRNALIAGGLSVEGARVVGYGSSRTSPGGDPVRNNRIELSFGGVTNQQKLNDAINRFQKLKSRPETCTEAGCK